MYLEALGMVTTVSGRFELGFWTNLHFPDIGVCSIGNETKAIPDLQGGIRFIL
jgi:hypothetical protein